VRRGDAYPAVSCCDNCNFSVKSFWNQFGLCFSLDLKSPDARKILERLVKWADVLIVNTPHPARKKLKLEYDDVAQWNSRQ
jgi:hypothetical protein